MEFKHEPVLLKECIQALEIKKDGIYVDGTLGGAGHSEEILKNLSENGKLIGIDRDEEALKAASKRLEKYKNWNIKMGRSLCRFSCCDWGNHWSCRCFIWAWLDLYYGDT